MLEPGSELAHYRIVEKIGAGGMGEVYRATDAKLGRDVAIKVLPESMAADADRLARFEREARALAQLNHPNIGAIYGLEEEPSTASRPPIRFLVLELIPGDTLAERIDRGPIPSPEALGIARQIACGMAEAHAAGILHRDLKPQNVKITPDGKVKVLDFGLAKPFLPDAASGGADLTQSPTLTFGGATQAGVLLGTAAYMAPEQARGQPVDRRADIWAFGVVLFELLTGKRMFDGGTVSDTLASVLKEEPNWEALPADIPPAARRLLRRTLVKNADQRLHDISDARLEIDEALTEPAATGEVPPPTAGGLSAKLPWVIAVLAIATAVWLGVTGFDRGPAVESRDRVAAHILPPPEFGFDEGMALSPDGTRLVFSARDAEGNRQLWLRNLDRTQARPIEGTEDGTHPFWSPDGRHVAFCAGEKLRKIDLQGGLVETLARNASADGGAWGSNGDILFRSGGAGSGALSRVAAGGGDPQPATILEVEGSDVHMSPSFLPDGKHFLFLLRTYGQEKSSGQVLLGSLDDPSESRLLFPSNSNAIYVSPGYILWWHDGNLRAQRFDPDSRELDGESFPLVPGVRFDPRDGLAAFTTSETGVLIYQEGGTESGNQLVWFDREGNELGNLGPAGSLYDPYLSADGSRVTLDISGETNQGDIWILDVERDTATRFTAFPEDDSSPVFSDDGRTIAFYSMHQTGRPSVWIKPTRGGSDARLVIDDPDADVDPRDWHGDVILVERTESDQLDIWKYTLSDETFEPWLATRFDNGSAAFSPDGRFVAYRSDESGQQEVYVQPFQRDGERWSPSRGGGVSPVWRQDGTELYYLSLADEIMAVPVGYDGDGLPLFGEPEKLFRPDIKPLLYPQFRSLDGQRFLVNTNLRSGADQPLTLLLNWAPEQP